MPSSTPPTATPPSTTLPTPGILRIRGTWSTMSQDERRDLTARGTERIFDPTLQTSIRTIFDNVREHGDAGVIEALRNFDHCTVPAGGLKVTEAEFAAARAAISPELLAAIRDGIDHVRRFNEVLMQRGDWSVELDPGLTIGEKITPIASVGLFVPSGKGSYPSVLVQLGTPAVVAGVNEIVVVVPPIPGSDGAVDPACLVAADELGIHNVYRVNGPAGIAALTFGTESIPKVAKLCGPGSPPVACAQVIAQSFGTTGVLLLGPSESLILADDSADPYYLAADLLNEAEHGPDSTSVLVTTSPELVDAVQDELAQQIAELPEPRQGYARLALGTNGGVVLASTLAEAADVANTFAPEHMQIVARDEQAVLDMIVNAGEILLGQFTTISMANYVLGCPAALPTSGYAVVGSGITVDAFRKASAVAKATREKLENMSSSVIAFTDHEGFPAHQAAVTRRLSPHPINPHPATKIEA